MKRLNIIFVGSSLILLSGCESYVSSIKHTFRQASIVSQEDLTDARTWIRDQPVYDYFNTINTITVLWDTPSVVAVARALDNMVDNVGQSTEGPQEQRFIVMMYGEQDDWHFVLRTSKGIYQPTIYRSYDLPLAYKTILGKRRMRFKKSVYELIFSVTEVLLPCSLECSNGSYRVAMTWEVADVA